jgi:hypothetical protein
MDVRYLLFCALAAAVQIELRLVESSGSGRFEHLRSRGAP